MDYPPLQKSMRQRASSRRNRRGSQQDSYSSIVSQNWYAPVYDRFLTKQVEQAYQHSQLIRSRLTQSRPYSRAEPMQESLQPSFSRLLPQPFLLPGGYPLYSRSRTDVGRICGQIQLFYFQVAQGRQFYDYYLEALDNVLSELLLWWGITLPTFRPPRQSTFQQPSKRSARLPIAS